MFINLFIFASAAVNVQKQLQNVTYEKFQVDFEYSYHEDDENVKSEKGNLSFNKNKYFIKFSDKKIIYNGKKLWNYDKKLKTVNVTKDIEDEDNPFFLLVNHKQLFEVENYVKKDNFYLITMIPKKNIESNLDIKYFEILCDEKFIKQINIFNEDESLICIKFDKWNLKINFPNNYFNFDPVKKNITVVDLD